MTASLGWGIVGTGAIAADFARAMAHARRGRVVAVVGRTPPQAAAFAARHGVARAAVTLDALVAARGVDAVYVATPHPHHEPAALAALAAGKAVLCEKPLTVDVASAERLAAAAEARGAFLLEAFMYRCHPVMGALLELVDAGVVGELRHVDAAFGFEATGPRTGRLFDPALGGGGVLDVGGYPVSFARLLAGRVERRAFAEPTKLEATGVVGPTGVDEVASAKLSFASGFTANVSCAVRRDLGTAVTIVGTRGRIELPNPWLPGGERQGLASSFTIHGDGKAPETITLRAPAPVYALQADLFAEALPTRAPRAPAMSLADSLGNMRVLDAWRTAVHAEARS